MRGLFGLDMLKTLFEQLLPADKSVLSGFREVKPKTRPFSDNYTRDLKAGHVCRLVYLDICQERVAAA